MGVKLNAYQNWETKEVFYVRSDFPHLVYGTRVRELDKDLEEKPKERKDDG